MKQRLERCFLLAGVSMVIAAGAAVVLKPLPYTTPVSDGQLLGVLPASIGDWRAAPEAEASREESDVGGAVSGALVTIHRAYVNVDGQVMLLTIRYGGALNDALQARRPEETYSSRGFEVSRLMRDRLHLEGRTVPVTRVVAMRGTRAECATYWTLMGGQVVRSRTEWLAAQLQIGFAGKAPEGVQVQVSSNGDELSRVFEGQDRFIASLAARVPTQAAEKLIGS